MDRAAVRSRRRPTFRFPHSEALLQNVLENAAVGDIARRYRRDDGSYANRAFSEMLGYEPDETHRLGAQGSGPSRRSAAWRASRSTIWLTAKRQLSCRAPLPAQETASRLGAGLGVDAPQRAHRAAALRHRPGHQHRRAEAGRGGAGGEREPLELRAGRCRAGRLGPDRGNGKRLLFAHVAADARLASRRRGRRRAPTSG